MVRKTFPGYGTFNGIVQQELPLRVRQGDQEAVRFQLAYGAVDPALRVTAGAASGPMRTPPPPGTAAGTTTGRRTTGGTTGGNVASKNHSGGKRFYARFR